MRGKEAIPMGDLSAVTGYYNAAVRILMPLLAVGLLLLCGRMLLRRRRKPRPLAAFVLEDGTRLPVTAEETAIGRSTVSDICLPVQSVSRRHAAQRAASPSTGSRSGCPPIWNTGIG